MKRLESLQHRGGLMLARAAVTLVALALATSSSNASASNGAVEDATPSSGFSSTEGSNWLGSSPPGFALAAGQASSLLPNGTWLASGGATGRARVSPQLILFNPAAHRSSPSSLGLMFARAGHTSTLLPDGKVFIHGGVDEHGATLGEDEIIDIVSGQRQIVASSGLLARSHHTATVLLDGRVLIAGGVDSRGMPLVIPEIYDPRTGHADAISSTLDTPRVGGVAVPLPDGRVLLYGGTDAQGREAATGSLYDPSSQRFAAVALSAARALMQPLVSVTSAPHVVQQFPNPGATDVGVASQLMVSFSTRLDVATVSSATVTLIGPSGTTPIKAIPVDNGMLLFVTPVQELVPASAYTLFVKGARDKAGQALPMFSVGFQTQSLQAAVQSSANASSETSLSTQGEPTPLPVSRTPAELSGIDEEWIPDKRHRKGEWMSHRAYLALSSLPRQPKLRLRIQSNTPTVPDSAALVTAQAVGEQTPKIPRATWSEVAAQAKAQNAAVQADAVPGTGMTALSGHVLRLNGLPLAHVQMQMGSVMTYTDANGEFLLSGVPSGSQVLTINAATANRTGATYGRFQYRYTVISGRTNLLPFTVWMAKLDTKHAVHIASPTVADTVISNPTMPGLSITLPAGTVVRDVDGKIVTEVSLTPIPVDQPPYPMPYAGVPLHYTLQPGGAVIESADGKPKGAVVRYPNYTSFGPGTNVKLFDYDAKGRGWYVYADAKVAPNGTDITSDRDFLIYQFGTTSYSSGGMPVVHPNYACKGASPDQPASGRSYAQGGSNAGPPASACSADPVDLQYGAFTFAERDMYLDDVMPIDFRRTYRYNSTSDLYFDSGHRVGAYGMDSTGSFESYLVFDPSGTQIQMTMGDRSVVNFNNPNGSPSLGYDPLTYQNTDDQGGYRGAFIQRNALDSTFVVTFKDGRHWAYSAYSARLIWMEDRVGNRMAFGRPNVNSYISQVTSPNGRYVNVSYYPNGLVSSLVDNLGRTFGYTYGTDQVLQTVTDPNGGIRLYGWDAGDFLTQVTDPNGKVMVKNTIEKVSYQAEPCSTNGGHYATIETGRVLSQLLADGSTFGFQYDTGLFELTNPNGCQPMLVLNASGSTQVTDRRGVVRKAVLDSRGNVVTNTAAVGKPEQQVSTFVYDTTTNLLTSETDALNRQATYQYDASANLAQVTYLAGTANAVSTSATYDPVFNQPLTRTDGNGLTTTAGYDALGNLISVKDPLGHTTYVGRDPQGRVNSITNALGKTWTFAYNGPDLSTVTDPLNRQTQFLTDAVGRVMTQIDGLGNRTYKSWDPLNRLTQITDALGGLTKVVYDPNGNMTTQTDANGHSSTYVYTGVGQIQTKTDALLNVETNLYEPGGLLRQRTDRKGQVSGVTYDNLGRVASVGFGATTAAPTAYTSTATLKWDAGNRLTSIIDVQAGKTTSITRAFDGLNRMTSEVTEQGEVDYTYDKGGRRTGMTVKNGPPTAQVVGQSLAYTFDDANRLSKIVQAAGPANNSSVQTITFAYDNANRLALQTEATGLNIGYTYTDADEVSGITYKGPTGAVIATGGYTYDAAGQRTSVTGDLATFVQASGTNISDAVYNENNQLTTWSGKAFVYDKNGNLTSDAVNTYIWDARGQLVGITGALTSSFQYDSARRRLAKTIGGTTNAYLYDGDNFVQELAGLGNTTAVNANLVTGGVDQVFVRGTGTGSTATLHWVMPEANNSTVILTDYTGAVQKSFTYDPYGNTTAGSGAENNSQQYTGRENDINGLYFYRNRFYMSGCMRFISEDPIGWASGQTNNYAYVNENPISSNDPLGLAAIIIGLFPGAGAQITIGQNPNGSGYMSLQFGFGVGGGGSFDAANRSPGYQPCQGNDWQFGYGLYADASVQAGPAKLGIGANVGRNVSGSGSSQYGGVKIKSSLKDSIAMKGSASMGGQLTLVGGGSAPGSTCGN